MGGGEQKPDSLKALISPPSLLLYHHSRILRLIASTAGARGGMSANRKTQEGKKTFPFNAAMLKISVTQHLLAPLAHTLDSAPVSVLTVSSCALSLQCESFSQSVSVVSVRGRRALEGRSGAPYLPLDVTTDPISERTANADPS